MTGGQTLDIWKWARWVPVQYCLELPSPLCYLMFLRQFLSLSTFRFHIPPSPRFSEILLLREVPGADRSLFSWPSPSFQLLFGAHPIMPIVQVQYIQQNNWVFHQGSLEGLFRHENLVPGLPSTLSRSHLSIQTLQMSALFQVTFLTKAS